MSMLKMLLKKAMDSIEKSPKSTISKHISITVEGIFYIDLMIKQ